MLNDDFNASMNHRAEKWGGGCDNTSFFFECVGQWRKPDNQINIKIRLVYLADGVFVEIMRKNE